MSGVLADGSDPVKVTCGANSAFPSSTLPKTIFSSVLFHCNTLYLLLKENGVLVLVLPMLINRSEKYNLLSFSIEGSDFGNNCVIGSRQREIAACRRKGREGAKRCYEVVYEVIAAK